MTADHDREERALLDHVGYSIPRRSDEHILLPGGEPCAVHCPTTFRRAQHCNELLHRIHVLLDRISPRPRPIAVLEDPAVRRHRKGARPRVLPVTDAGEAEYESGPHQGRKQDSSFQLGLLLLNSVFTPNLLADSEKLPANEQARNHYLELPFTLSPSNRPFINV